MAGKLQKKERIVSRLNDVLIFLVVFNILAVPLYVALYTDFSIGAVQELNAKLLYGTLKALGYQVETKDAMVYLISDGTPRFIEISWDSTGWKSMYAVAALIIATPISVMSRKVRFIALGILSMFVLNYFRITTTVLISAVYGFQAFDLVHTILWREALIVSVVAFWVIWLAMEKYNIGKIQIKIR
ncbi:MAG: exosortase/archaeosortase family protein [Candidatus Aenigmarchaeota archaeon]|nr:exosortase/archaeosortase family protein [Candidatus Aenigmarchaeota archaeon]